MIRLDLELDPRLTEVLHERLFEVVASLGKSLPRPTQLPAEEEFRAVWLEGLREVLGQDCEVLIDLLGREDFGRGPLELSEEQGEATVRACSALRLKLREHPLAAIPDEQLETGDVQIENLSASEQEPFMCYLFLAGLQGALVEEMDPGGV